MSIQLGNPAVSTSSYYPSGYTLINNTSYGTPPSSGIITSCAIYAHADLTGTNYVGCWNYIYSESDGQSGALGTISGGSLQTITGLNFSYTLITANDEAAGIYYSAGTVCRNDTGGNGINYKSGNQFGQGSVSLSSNSGYKLSFYLIGISAAVVTTQEATNVGISSFTANGNITDTGGIGNDITTRGFCYTVGTSGDPTISDSTIFDTGSFSTGSYSKGITGAVPNTGYRERSYCINIYGTFYGSTVQVTTNSSIATQADTDTLSDSIIKNPKPVEADTDTLSDSIIKNPKPVEADTDTLSDNFSRIASFSREEDDISSVSDEIVKSYQPTESDSNTLSDDLEKNNRLNKSDTVTLSDYFERVVYFSRLIEELDSLSDNITKIVEKENDDTITLSDDLSKIISSLQEDIETLSDDLVKISYLEKDDSATISDNIVKEFDSLKEDTISLIDEIVKSTGMNKDDLLSLMDVISYQAPGHLFLNEESILSDDIAKNVSIIENDIATLLDNILVGLVLFLALGDGLGLTDNVKKLTQLLETDTMTLSDAILSLLIIITLFFNDSAALNDNIAKLSDIVKKDLVIELDQISKQVKFIESDTFILQESFSYILNKLIEKLTADKILFAQARNKIISSDMNKIKNITAKERK